MDTTAIIFVIVALALGALVGWLLGSRSSAAGQGVADSLRLQLDGVREERDVHARSIETLRREHGDLAARYAAMVASQAERDRSHQQQLDGLESKFAEVGGKLLESAQTQFLARADQRFKESEATSGNNLKALLQPVHERLQKYEETVIKVERERAQGRVRVAVRPYRGDEVGYRARLGRGRQAGQCAAQRTQGARSLG